MTEEEKFAGHLKDLAQRSYQDNIFTFTGFLGEGELSCLLNMKKELQYAGLRLFGGTQHAERCIARFGNPDDLGYEQEFPIRCLRIEPLVQKFAEELSHRDYLGAIMSLGIERNLLGDIYIDGKTAYLFCLDHIADYLKQNLTQIRHTNIRITETARLPEQAGPKLKEVLVIAASSRIDAVISGVYHLSRNQGQNLLSSGKVFINGKECENRSASCSPGDRISVRGYGKFIFDGVEGATGKGRSRIRVRIFC